jgi:hypothetical protein
MRILLAPLLLLSACTQRPEGCENARTDGATASCLEPTQSPEFYVEEALKYFDTLDVEADRSRVPDYHPDVVRWEWPPWLLLTGFTAQSMDDSAAVLRVADPSTVPERECRAFDIQPFARCYVVFEYEGGSCPIYEEFVFDDEGRTTFIEAWSDLPGLLPHADPSDRWAEDQEIGRLSTRVPGLGSASGFAVDTEWMRDAAEEDADVAELQTRAADFWQTWLDELENADPDFFAVGCGWQSQLPQSPE